MSAANSRSSFWVGASASACVALGAATTWWLSSAMPGRQRLRRPVAVQGELLNAPAIAAAKSSAASGGVFAVVRDGDYTTVTFDVLGSYYYETPSSTEAANAPAGVPKIKDQIPAPIKTLNERRVAVQGFMLPLKVENGLARNFMLLKDRSLCCFGRMPRMNEWIAVSMLEGRTARYVNDQVVTVFGTLEVGEQFEGGQLMSIYRLKGEQLAGPL